VPPLSWQPGLLAACLHVAFICWHVGLTVQLLFRPFSAGGLDTSIILKWLQDTYGCEVVTFTADLGQVGTTGLQTQATCTMHEVLLGCLHGRAGRPCAQGEELEPARKKAEMFGVKQIFVDDLREEFVRDYVFPMFR
jgi:argininosuccinate synthase